MRCVAGRRQLHGANRVPMEKTDRHVHGAVAADTEGMRMGEKTHAGCRRLQPVAHGQADEERRAALCC